MCIFEKNVPCKRDFGLVYTFKTLAAVLNVVTENKSLMKTFLAVILWCILLVICWPVALLILFLYPVIWLILLPFRIVGLTIEAVFKLIGAILLLPFRILKAI